MTGPTNKQMLQEVLGLLKEKEVTVSDDEVPRRLENIENQLKEQNGCLKVYGETLAIQGQWIKDHTEHVHGPLDTRIDAVDKKTNWVGTLNVTLTALVGGLLAWLKGSK